VHLEKIGIWVQIFSSVAVLVGLGLVISELQLMRRNMNDQFALSNVLDWSSDISAL